MRLLRAGPSVVTFTTLAVFWQISHAQQRQSYDYVIIGGGTSGLLVANRLSADPTVTVAIIEPGADERNNALVSNPQTWAQLSHTAVDWVYQSVPEPQLDNRVITWSAGKGIGGSSLINGETSSPRVAAVSQRRQIRSVEPEL